jgi:hypothetical protein
MMDTFNRARTPRATVMQPEEIGQTIATAILDRGSPGAPAQRAGAVAAAGREPLDDPVRAGGLHHDGLVTFEANRGAFVAKPTLAEAHFLFEAIAAIERSAVDIILAAPGRLAGRPARRASQAGEGARPGQHAPVGAARDRLPPRAAGAHGNPLLIDAQRKLLLRYRIVTAVFKTELAYCELEDHHGELIELLESGSAAKLRRLVDMHWRLVIRGHISVNPGVEDLAEALRLRN